MLYLDQTKSPRERAEDLLSRLTLREKVGQINQKLYGFACYERKGEEIRLTPAFQGHVEKFGGLGVLYGLYRADPWSQKDYANGLSGVGMKRAYNLVQGFVLEHSRLRIPALMSSECPHGHQALDGYLLPVNLGVGAAWNPELTKRAYGVCGRQLRGLGVGLALISMLDVLRDPRWGRSEECYGEDPYLCGALARAAVMGCQEAGVGVVAKHFCAQGETTGGVNASAARIGPRELREIHLPPMEACCQAGVAGVMAAYNEIDGVYCHANPWLLQDVLRGELGFKGLVMADGGAIDRLDSLTGGAAASGALALRSGVDVSLWDDGFTLLEEAVKAGLADEADVDRAALGVLEMKFAQGLFEHPFLEEEPPHVFSYNSHPESLELARQGAVLLKNEGLLPIKQKGLRVAVIGPNGDSVYNQLGDYTPAQREGVCVTLREGLERLLGAGNVRYAQGCPVCGIDESGIPAAVGLAQDSSLVVLALGGSSSRFAGADFEANGAARLNGPLQMDCGEGVDCSSLGLPGSQAALARAIFATGKPVAAVVIAGRPYAIPELAERAQSLLYAFYPGPMGGQALAEILTGAVCPSGKLPVSLPRSAGQLPCYYNPKRSYRPMEYCDLPAAALYPFGFGLSYTSFKVSHVRFPAPVALDSLRAGQRAEVRFTVENTGRMDGWAVAQLFVQDLQASTVRRERELKAFQKVFLQAGGKKGCVLSLGWEELALWDAAMRYTVEPGGFRLLLSCEGQTLSAVLDVLD